ncbi:GATA transcription factor 5 [Cucumis melo var. makuwa]|uniref:GATA transcription factor n=2 Tax=Cucumis melo TaxID=3656 RepID=A0A5A7TQJ0_CUCMM|nr:GATA transcription factor 5 [Cucumis melo var. makuwa]TYK02623.1 GATA transcription factor 5 [Cucumis melo var. makuwa]
MEFLEAKALKSSFHWELAMKSAQQDALVEEVWCLNGANLVSGEDFEIEEFLNFSNGDLEHGSSLRPQEDDDCEEFEKNRFSLSSNSNQTGGSPVVGDEDSKSLLAVELAFPGDSLTDLEWVSQFVDDSSSEFSCPAVAFNRSEPEKKLTGTVISCLPTFFPVRPRTKRSRQSRQAKSAGSSLNQSPSSSSSSTSSGVSSAAPWFIFSDAGENVDSLNVTGEPPKKQRKKPSSPSPSSTGLLPTGSTGQIPRRCSHCLVQKTPQWRTGPNGAKTLCNACGVRYKSGRLFPEYRPALSPTFCSGVHSNSHRKVLEMRKTKEVSQPATELAPMVPSY